MRSILPVAALLIPSLAFGQAAIKSERVSVASTNDEWTPTSIEVASGDVVLVLAKGRVKLGQYSGAVGPNGNSNGGGQLQIKIGVGAGQRAGEKAFIIADQAGPVKLRVLDTRYDDNSGAFDVMVIHIPASMIPVPNHPNTSASESSNSEAAYVAAMKSDLRNLVTAEEAYFADSVKYTTKIGRGGVDFGFTQGTQLLTLVLSGDGWGARVGHEGTGITCAIYVGKTPMAPAMKEGVPACQF